jgi:hypothetical protein
MPTLLIVIVKSQYYRQSTLYFRITRQTQEVPQCNETRFSTTEYRHLSRLQSSIMIKATHTPSLVSIGEYCAETEFLFLATVTLTFITDIYVAILGCILI